MLRSGRLGTGLRIRAGITDLTFHDLRHEGLSEVRVRHEIPQVMAISGHRTASQLLDMFNFMNRGPCYRHSRTLRKRHLAVRKNNSTTSAMGARAMIKTNDIKPKDIKPKDIKLGSLKPDSARPAKSTLSLAERDAGCTAACLRGQKTLKAKRLRCSALETRTAVKGLY